MNEESEILIQSDYDKTVTRKGKILKLQTAVSKYTVKKNLNTEKPRN